MLQSLLLRRRNAVADVPLWYAYEAALNWVLDHRLPESGIAISNVQGQPYPEVTGYLIPTLREAGEADVAVQLARWLMSVQTADGGFEGPDGEPHLFDTGQALRGLLAVLDILPEAAPRARRAAEWMLASTDEHGVLRPSTTSAWSRTYGSAISENIHLYVLPPLAQAGRVFDEPRYGDCVARSLAYYVSKPDLLRFDSITHFYGYVLEALADLGRPDLARLGFRPVLEAQRRNGDIPGLPGGSWTCSPGAAQMAVVGYKLGSTAAASAALDHLQTLQLSSGGFLGSYGPGAWYLPSEEISWACKYFLDACHLRIRATFDQQHDRFTAPIAEADARLAAILSAVPDTRGMRILDVGCGSGRFLHALLDRDPTAELWGVDISTDLLRQVQPEVHTRRASMLDLPFASALFDVVICVEALEHAVRIERAISEMCRVLKPGGRIIIVDKDVAQLGVMPIERWERWFAPSDITGILERHCGSVHHESIEAPWMDGRPPLFVAWHGVRHDGPVSAPENGCRRPATPRNETDVIGRYSAARCHAEAQLLAQHGFAMYRDNDLGRARRAFLGAVRRDPRWLRNRGVLSILVQSVVPRSVSSLAHLRRKGDGASPPEWGNRVSGH